ncbi:MAG: elongation factor G [Gemmataceae bacterium]
MGRHAVADVRDIALVGHRAAGKTSLADALLYEAHAVDRLGKVDDGTSVADTDEDEHRHHFSIDTHVLHAEHAGKHLHILDTPGTPDFIGAALEGLSAVETAVVVVSAVNGIETNTRKMFKEATDRGLSRAVVINKLDADKVDFPGLVAAVQEAFGRQCVPFNVPTGTGDRFTGVICAMEPVADVPKTCPLDPNAVRSQLIDAVVEADESLTEKFLLEGAVTADELEAAVPKALAAGTLIPIFCTSATKDVGVKELLDALSRYGLSPSYAKRRLEGMTVGNNGQAKPVEPTEASEFLGQVFKVVNDRYVGHLSFIRVLAGKLTPNHQIYDVNTGRAVKVGQLLLVQGKTHVPVPEAVPGDIVAVAKVDGLHVGDTVAYRSDVTLLPAFKFPSPMFGLAIEPKNRGDEQKISAGLHKIAEEDPTIKIQHDPQTHEMVISGVSQLHLEVVQERLKHRFDVDVVTKEPKVPYHETITAKGEADYRHKKQTGGRGQFAEVHLRVYPISREITTKEQLEEQFANKSNFEKLRSVHYDPAQNFAFLDHIVGGSIPNNFLPAIEKGCKEVMERGALAGYRMQDIAVEVHFGKYHDVDSSEAAFKTAGRQAFKRALLAARPALLEPIVKMEVTVPSKYTGAILGDLPTKRAHVDDQNSLPGDLTVISARAPLSEVTRYAAQLGGLTQGQGSYSMELSHYEQVPANVQQQVVAKAAHKDEEEE